jgi:hypothetical protein
MPTSITDNFKINKKKFDSTGAFDSLLEIDSKFHVDPVVPPKNHIRPITKP